MLGDHLEIRDEIAVCKCSAAEAQPMTTGKMLRHAKQIIDQFSHQADTLSAARGSAHDQAIRQLLAATRVAADDVALDVACGTGQVAVAFAGIAKHVTGIDLTPAVIHRARALQAAAGSDNIRWLIGNVEHLPFPSASFSVVICRYAFHHMVDPAAVAAEMARVCAPAGRVALVDVITTPNKAAAYDDWERLRDPSHVRALTQENLVGLAEDNGLERVKCEFYTFDIALETLLSGSFPAAGDAHKVRELVIQDIGRDRLGVAAHRRGDMVVVSYPIVIVVGEVPTVRNYRRSELKSGR